MGVIMNPLAGVTSQSCGIRWAPPIRCWWRWAPPIVNPAQIHLQAPLFLPLSPSFWFIIILLSFAQVCCCNYANLTNVEGMKAFCLILVHCNYTWCLCVMPTEWHFSDESNKQRGFKKYIHCKFATNTVKKLILSSPERKRNTSQFSFAT